MAKRRLAAFTVSLLRRQALTSVFKRGKAAINHLIRISFEIARIYGQGGRLLMSQLLADGIRHFTYYKTKRPSLSTALLPFKKLSNEILRTPIPGYPEAAINSIRQLSHSPGQRRAYYEDLVSQPTNSTRNHHKAVELTALIKEKIENFPNTPIHRVASVTLGNIPLFSGQSKPKVHSINSTDL